MTYVVPECSKACSFQLTSFACDEGMRERVEKFESLSTKKCSSGVCCSHNLLLKLQHFQNVNNFSHQVKIHLRKLFLYNNSNYHSKSR